MMYHNRSDLVSSVLYFSDMPHGGHTERLYYCKADIIIPDFSEFIILRSYSTIVAAFSYETEALYVFGYYSATTSQHVAKFRNWIRYSFPYKPWSFPRRVYLYNDSRTGKRAARKNIDDDFASLISG